MIAITSFCSWGSGWLISTSSDASNDRKLGPKFWLVSNLILNLGILAVFKYFNFFVDSFVHILTAVGIPVHSTTTLNIVLPVGISFYTFQALSYGIDIYRKELEPTRDWLQFFAFVSFFPQLVAGPIERAKNLLPQFETIKKPDYDIFRSAMLLMAWGYFKKLMIADRLAVFVEATFDHGATAFPMLLGAIFFAFQLYLDFSAYSDIAIGCGKLFGFNLMTNFRRPYFSTSFSNFWKRWHISLSSWFMDYLYIPLGGNRKGKARKILNLIIVFAVSGLWHGASWNFVIWGVANALFMILLDPFLKMIRSENFFARSFKAVIIFTGWTLSLIFFRAKGFDTAIDCFSHLGFSNVGDITNFGLNSRELWVIAITIGILFLKELLWERNEQAIPNFFFKKVPMIFRWCFYIAFVLSIVYFGQYGGGNEHSFIYFQF